MVRPTPAYKLITGGGESGKSTIAKQMKILHSNGFDGADMINVRYIAQNNIITSVDQLIIGIKDLGIQLSKPNKVKEFHCTFYSVVFEYTNFRKI